MLHEDFAPLTALLNTLLNIGGLAMADTEKVLAAARDVGKLIAQTTQAKGFEKAVQSLDKDVDAQRLLADLNRATGVLVQKQASGQPIEVAEKHKLEELRGVVATNITIGNFQMAQMDLLDLMRRVDDAIGGETALGTPGGGMAGSPGGSPGPGGAPGGGEDPSAGAGPIITG